MPTNPQPGYRNGNASHHETPGPASRRSRIWLTLAAFLALAGAASFEGQNDPQSPRQSIVPALANRFPDKNDQMQMNEQREKDKTQRYAAANAERKKQIADDSTKLLKLANELKSDVDNTSKDTLSLGVIRKAEAIEKLAHGVKEKMKLSVGTN